MPTLAVNKRARLDYQISDKYEAGLVLQGSEVKSIKSGHISLKESFVTIKESELFLTNAHISFYKQAGAAKNYNPTRPRKLLLRKSEIKHLTGKMRIAGLTLIPLRVYTKKRPARNVSLLNKNIFNRTLGSGLKKEYSPESKHSDAGGLIKLEFGIGKGKNKFDKREDLKKKDANRDMQRALKNF
ncbi:MAG: SsrA-binding protein [Candidatus Moranbacteria bacterium CG_4_9_14_3_um_filter_40_7]|nr:MAG: SsrA-binding protein [Candidatus Moranbacteria bacterium CG23_combo_of_CG06-09_8_20_14_all_40_16]PIU80461.1 MAG: SsrA-binding protein [Candidatus Moranbacteria bacterium CG06_land_8_20_14_3_00_40_12]PJA88129.1 MAG: SsrA-binding protein [Candidatus Moranbacteria bacterium CG_4_9_14_3_um_filter_40_7]